jgi:hypothetical protein
MHLSDRSGQREWETGVNRDNSSRLIQRRSNNSPNLAVFIVSNSDYDSAAARLGYKLTSIIKRPSDPLSFSFLSRTSHSRISGGVGEPVAAANEEPASGYSVVNTNRLQRMIVLIHIRNHINSILHPPIQGQRSRPTAMARRIAIPQPPSIDTRLCGPS